VLSKIAVLRQVILLRFKELENSKPYLHPQEDDEITFTPNPNSASNRSVTISNNIRNTIGEVFTSSVKPSLCVAYGDCLKETLCGSKSNFTIQTKEYSGQAKRKGGARVEILIHGLKEPPIVEDQNNGWYNVSFTHHVPGNYAMAVMVNGKHIEGSPFVLKVQTKSWTFDMTEANTEGLRISNNLLTATNTSGSNASVLGTVGLTTGKHSWRIRIESLKYNQWIAIGIATKPLPNKTFNYNHAWCFCSSNWKYSKGIRTAATSGNWLTGETLEITVDCDTKEMKLENFNTLKTDFLSGFSGTVFPYFNLGQRANSISLILNR